jgi:pantoate--beta-alanine ligase
VAARVGTTRLIDNQPLLVGPGGGAIEVFSDVTVASTLT